MTTHTYDDGRGLRDVFLNGKKIERAFFADTDRGIVRFFRYPLRLHKYKKRALYRTLRGNVEVRQNER